MIYLTRSPHRTRAREHLIGLLWADRPDAAARHSLNEALRVMRRTLGKEAVATDGSQVRLALASVRIDTEEFEALVGVGDWKAAAGLIRGEFLEGFAVKDASEFENWLAGERQSWREKMVHALVRSAELLAGFGDIRYALANATRALGLDPASNQAVRTVMRTLALSGERAAALECYEGFRRRIGQSAGATPERETELLAERIRRERTWRVAPPDSPSQGSRRAPLIGREPELECLIGAWDRCRRDRLATAVIVSGDGGVGKTRLVEEIQARARLDGAGVVSVRAVEADLGDALGGILGLARGGLMDLPGVAAVSPATLAAFASRLPAWAERFPAAAHLPPAPLGRALSDVLRALLEEQPVVLSVDDAHWLDRESVLGLSAALRDLAASPIFLLLSICPDPPREELDALRARIGRDLPGENLRLRELSLASIRALVQWAMPGWAADQIDRLARRVAIESAGLPLFAIELLHAVRLGLDLREGTPTWPEPSRTLTQTLPGDLPEAVVAAIRIGFRRLSPAAQRVLLVAAVPGERVTPEQVQTLSGLPVSELLLALDELEWQRWLIAEPRGYSFLARIVREVVAQDMVTTGQRQRLKEGKPLPPST